MQTKNIILSGFGGQGIVAAGKTIIYAAMLDGKTVSLLPSYGPEMRGGFANCHAIISESEIASPIISMADVVIAMSFPALDKFESKVKPGGTLIIDSYQAKKQAYRHDIRVVEVPATKMAIDAGNVKFANVVMMGVMMEVLSCPTMESMAEAIMNMLPGAKKSLYDSEMNALYLGKEYINNAAKLHNVSFV